MLVRSKFYCYGEELCRVGARGIKSFHRHSSKAFLFVLCTAAPCFSSLARIFHTDLLQKPGIMMNTLLDSPFDLGGMAPYSPASQCSSALSHQASQLPRHDQDEISGLAANFQHTSGFTSIEVY